MFTVNEDNSIYATRGDIVFFKVSAKEEDGTAHEFAVGDEVRIRIFDKKGCEKVYLDKAFPVMEKCQEVPIYLSKEDTKFGELINKPKDYWYEVEVNTKDAPQTIIGYSDAGPAVFRLYPEGKEVGE